MFGKAGLGGLMQQAQKMQENMKKAQAELAVTEVNGEAGNGLVKVVMTCNHEVKSISISPDLIAEAAEDKEMLEDLVLAAVKRRPRSRRRPHLVHHGTNSPKACPAASATSSNNFQTASMPPEDKKAV